MNRRTAGSSPLIFVSMLAIACTGGDATPGAATATLAVPSGRPPSATPFGPEAATPVGPPPASGTAATGRSTPGAIADRWEPRAPAPFSLTEVAAAAHNGRIWVAGGLGRDGNGSTVVQIYDPGEDSWAEGPRLPEPVHHAALVSTGTNLYLLGGYVGSGFQSPTAAVRLLAPDGAVWLDAPSLPEERAAGAAAWDGARIVYGGGVGRGGVSDTVFALEPAGWLPIGRLSVGREHLAATSDAEGAVWFLGGRLGGLESNVATVDLVERAGVGALTEVPTARGGVAAFWHERSGACLVGGEGPSGTFAEVECVADGTVQTLPPLAAPRHGLGAAVVDGTAYVLVGGPQPGLTVSDMVEALDVDR
jgi:non-specific serine/threonine protein kinase